MFRCQGSVKYWELHLGIIFSQVSSAERTLPNREHDFVYSVLRSSAEHVGQLRRCYWLSILKASVLQCICGNYRIS